MQTALLIFVIIFILCFWGIGIYFTIFARRLWEWYYSWLERLEEKMDLRSPADKTPAFPSLIFHKWIMKRAPWPKTISILVLRITGIWFVVIASFMLFEILKMGLS